MSEVVKINFQKLRDWTWLIFLGLGALVWAVQEFTVLKSEIRIQKEQINHLDKRVNEAYNLAESADRKAALLEAIAD